MVTFKRILLRTHHSSEDFQNSFGFQFRTKLDQLIMVCVVVSSQTFCSDPVVVVLFAKEYVSSPFAGTNRCPSARAPIIYSCDVAQGKLTGARDCYTSDQRPNVNAIIALAVCKIMLRIAETAVAPPL